VAWSDTLHGMRASRIHQPHCPNQTPSKPYFPLHPTAHVPRIHSVTLPHSRWRVCGASYKRQASTLQAASPTHCAGGATHTQRGQLGAGTHSVRRWR
jgi:hypothetical protein